MESIDQRLKSVFLAAFPDLGDLAVEQATLETVDLWDSVMTLTLIALAEEEFGVWIGYDLLPSLSSYQAFRDLLIKQGVSAGATVS